MVVEGQSTAYFVKTKSVIISNIVYEDKDAMEVHCFFPTTLVIKSGQLLNSSFGLNIKSIENGV